MSTGLREVLYWRIGVLVICCTGVIMVPRNWLIIACQNKRVYNEAKAALMFMIVLLYESHGISYGQRHSKQLGFTESCRKLKFV